MAERDTAMRSIFRALVELPVDAKSRAVTIRLLQTFCIIGVIGLVTLVFTALSMKGHVGQALMTAAAAASVGGLVGFLFGIPRVGAEATSVPRTAEEAAMPILKANTNLERISDWLATMLIGVGLAQAREIATGVGRLATWLAPAFEGGAPVAAMCLVTFAIWGFFASYLSFRMFFTLAFSETDYAVQAFDRKVNEARKLERQGDAARAAGKEDAGKELLQKAALSYKSALTTLPANTPPDLRRRLTESAVMNALYADMPDGYRNAIEIGTDYLSQSSNPKSASLQYYLAAAYGQMYWFERDRGASRERLQEIERLALDKARAAIEADPSKRDSLRRLWDPQLQVGNDNDLQVFHPSLNKEAMSDWTALLGG